MSEHTIHHDKARHRFTVSIDGQEVGHADYAHRPGGVIDFNHTYVEPAFRGRGLAGRMIAAGLDWARTERADVIASCWAVDEYIKSHPEYEDLRAR